MQRSAAMGALRPLLRQPPPDANIATELRAMGAQVRIAELFHADEASENLGEGLENKEINLTNKSTTYEF